MNRNKLITDLQSSNLYAECTLCSNEFRLSDAVLFDGLGAFPDAAEIIRQNKQKELYQRLETLKQRKVSADVGAEKKAIEVGVGKIIEKIVPAHKMFKMPLCDCRPLFEPIDFIVFNGLSSMNVDSLTFLEIKTGKAQLSKHERMVRDAVKDKKVSYKVI